MRFSRHCRRRCLVLAIFVIFGLLSVNKDTEILSEKGKDMAAKASGQTAQKEEKESPVVEMREEAGKQIKSKSIAEG